MRFPKYLMLLATFTLLLPASGFARSKNRGTMTLMEPAKIGSTELQPGTYKVEWHGSGPAVQVNITQDKKTVAATTAKLKTNDAAASQDAVVLQPMPNSNSAKQIAEIDFGSLKEALVITANQMKR
jgi:hypothetical protein